MAIPSKQIGWSQKSNLLWQISKQLEYLTGVLYKGTTTTTSSTSSTTTTTTTPPSPFSGTVDIIASPYCLNSPSYSSNVSGDSSFCNSTQFTSGTFMTIPAGTWAIRDQITLSLLNITTNGSGVAIVDTGVVCYECTTTTTTTATPTTTTTTTVFPYVIGDLYGGGVIAYILQPGDSGYISGETHGLIAAYTDITPYPTAGYGCLGTVITGADGTAIGTGLANTIAIITDCATIDTAARRCYDLVDSGYSDWYLPSLDELNQLYLNRAAINASGAYLNAGYWSSSEYFNNANYAWAMNFSPSGSQQFNIKTATTPVRAIRSF